MVIERDRQREKKKKERDKNRNWIHGQSDEIKTDGVVTFNCREQFLKSLFTSIYANPWIRSYSIYVTSFFSISSWSNSEYWTQKHIQSGNLHSIIFSFSLKCYPPASKAKGEAAKCQYWVGNGKRMFLNARDGKFTGFFVKNLVPGKWHMGTQTSNCSLIWRFANISITTNFYSIFSKIYYY